MSHFFQGNGRVVTASAMEMPLAKHRGKILRKVSYERRKFLVSLCSTIYGYFPREVSNPRNSRAQYSYAHCSWQTYTAD
jgi:hypothetical protein